MDSAVIEVASISMDSRLYIRLCPIFREASLHYSPCDESGKREKEKKILYDGIDMKVDVSVFKR